MVHYWIQFEDVEPPAILSSLTVTPLGQEESVVKSKYLLRVTLFGKVELTKTVTVRGVSLGSL